MRDILDIKKLNEGDHGVAERAQTVKDATAKARPAAEVQAEHAKRVAARQAQRYAA